MNRKNFLKTAALSAGAMAISPIALAGIKNPSTMNLLKDDKNMVEVPIVDLKNTYYRVYI